MPEEPDQCFFCYDEFSPEKPKATENIVGCPCKFPIHEECWDKWDIYQCPICHKRVTDASDDDDNVLEYNIQELLQLAHDRRRLRNQQEAEQAQQYKISICNTLCLIVCIFIYITMMLYRLG
jgi:hypothetical protein